MLVPHVYAHVEVFFYNNHPLLKALLIILPKHSLIQSRQCNGKKNSVKMQPRKVKIMEKSHGAPFLKTSLGAPGKYPLLPPTTSRWACMVVTPLLISNSLSTEDVDVWLVQYNPILPC